MARTKESSKKDVFSALASQDRLEILSRLKDGDKNVGQLCALLGKEQTGVSHDLKRLVAADFVRVAKDGKFRIYSLNRDFADPFLSAISPAPTGTGNLKSVIDQAPISMSVIDKDGFFLFVGGGVEDTAGKGHQFYIGKNIFEIFADYTVIIEHTRRSLKANGPYKWTYDQGGHLYEVMSQPYRDEKGAVAGVVSVSYDVSQRLNDEKIRAISEAERNWRMLVEGSPDIIVQTDPDGVILAINHAFNGLDRSAVIGSSLYGYIDAESRGMTIRQIASVFSTGAMAVFEARAAGKLRSAAWHECRVVPYWKEGKIVAVTITMRETPPEKK